MAESKRVEPTPSTHSTRDVLEHHHSKLVSFEEWTQKVLVKLAADNVTLQRQLEAMNERIKALETKR
jgi:hypothetical protein